MRTGVNRSAFIRAEKPNSTGKHEPKASRARHNPSPIPPLALSEADMDELVGIVDGNITLKHHHKHH